MPSNVAVSSGIYLNKTGCRGPIRSFRTGQRLDRSTQQMTSSSALPALMAQKSKRESLRPQDDRAERKRIGLVPDMVVRPSRTASTRFTNCSSQSTKNHKRTIHHFCRRPRIDSKLHTCAIFLSWPTTESEPRGSPH
jgi:hypothetical protein